MIIKLTILFALIVIGYFLVINLISVIPTNLSLNEDLLNSQFKYGLAEKVGASATASVTVKRKRIYGTIFEELGEDYKISNLYLLGFFKVPLQNKSHNFKIIHLTAFSIISILYILMIIPVMLTRRYERRHTRFNGEMGRDDRISES